MPDDPETWRFSWEGWPGSRLKILDGRTGEERFALKRHSIGKLVGAFGVTAAIAAGGSASVWAAMRQGWIGYPVFFLLAGLALLGGVVAGSLLSPGSPILISTDPEGREPLLYLKEEISFLCPRLRMLAPDGLELGCMKYESRALGTKLYWRMFGSDGEEILLASSRSRFFLFYGS